jgi:tripartite-type tricarboxylate transporter receptor subunit TctC
MKDFRRRAGKSAALTILLPLIVLSCWIAGPARAEYPERPIRGVVPFAPGGASDILARLYAERFQNLLKGSIYIENKPGAGGNIGIQTVIAAKPDGYTLLFCSIATTQNPALYRKAPYDIDALVPVAQLGEAQMVIAVNSSKMPVKTMAEMVAAIKKSPGKYNAAAGGIGTKLVEEIFKLQNDLKFEIIMYKSAGEAATAVLKAETDFIIVDSAPLGAVLATGKVTPLAVSGAKRLPAYPNVPTTREAGFGNYQESSHFGLYVPRGTPEPIVQKLHTLANQINHDTGLIEKLQVLGWTPVIKSRADFTRFYYSDIARWKDLVKKANVATFD